MAMTMIQKPPTSVEVGGLVYEIEADFRSMIEVEELITGKAVTAKQEEFAAEVMDNNPDISHEDAIRNAKYYEALDIFYKGNIPIELNGAIEKMIWFYGCGKEEKKGRKKSSKVLYSYKDDFDYINAGFLQDYKMDLFEIDFLHWWKFVSLFTSLRDDCKIREIIGYRGADTTKMDKERKKFYREMQKAYALPQDRLSSEEEELKNKIQDALLHGGDVGDLLKSREHSEDTE